MRKENHTDVYWGNALHRHAPARYSWSEDLWKLQSMKCANAPILRWGVRGSQRWDRLCVDARKTQCVAHPCANVGRANHQRGCRGLAESLLACRLLCQPLALFHGARECSHGHWKAKDRKNNDISTAWQVNSNLMGPPHGLIWLLLKFNSVKLQHISFLEKILI